MTREQVKEQFPDATDEQITALLNINGTDLENAKRGSVEPKVLKKLQEDAEAYGKLQEAGLTDAEKMQNALDAAKDAEMEFSKKSNKLDVEKILVQAGLAEDDYKELIDGIVSDDAEKSKSMATALADMISKQKEATEQRVKEELMDDTPNNDDGGASNDEKSEDVQFAEEVSASFMSGNKESENAFKNY